jgi:large subunit ribosomal protein L17
MRHGTSGRKLGRTSSHRLAMFRNMVTSLLEHERIYTTDAKAKELRRWADWMITLGKRGDLHARRQALQVIRDKSVVHKLFTDLAQRYQARSGGYTRKVKVGFRVGDGAPLSLIELLTGETEKKKKKKKTKAPKAAKVKAPAVEVAPETEPEVAEVPEAEPQEAAAEEVPEKKKKAKGKEKTTPKAEKAAVKEKAKAEPEISEAEPEAAAEESTKPAKKEKPKKADQ